MTTRTRYFMLASFAILVAGLCTGMVAYYGGLPLGAFANGPGPAELRYVPPGATVVAYADVREVMGSELRRRMKSAMPGGDDGQGRQEFQRQTGIDVERDIDHVVAAMVPGAGDSIQNDSGFIALRGQFDPVRLEALAREHGALVEEYRGKRLLRIEHQGPPREAADEPPAGAPQPNGPAPNPERHRHMGGAPRTMALAFAEPGVVLAGDERAVRLALDTAASGRDVTADGEVMGLVKSVSDDGNAWAVGRFDVLASRAHLPEGMSAQIPAIRYFAASGRINGGVHGRVRAEARDEQAAQNLRDVATGLMALGRMQMANRPELQSALQSLSLGGTGKTVELSFAVPTELLDTLMPRARRVE